MRKGQIKIGETIGILVIFFLLLVFGFGFFGGVEKSNVNKAEQKAFELKTIEVAQTVLFLSELQCTEEESVDIDCFDLLKVQEFYDLTSNEEKYKQYYFNILGRSKITLYQVYPDKEEWDLYDNFGGTVGGSITRKLITNIPVSILDPVSGHYNFGYLQVEVAK